MFLLGCYTCIFHGTGNLAQLCQNFGISGAGGLNPPTPSPLGMPLPSVKQTNSRVNIICLLLTIQWMHFFTECIFHIYNVCVCVCERERDRGSVCVCVCVYSVQDTYIVDHILNLNFHKLWLTVDLLEPKNSTNMDISILYLLSHILYKLKLKPSDAQDSKHLSISLEKWK
jgi:hypothetical protein